MPENLQTVVGDRLAALSADVVELLQRVEMLHDRHIDVVPRLAEADGLLDALDRVVDAGVFETTGDRLTSPRSENSTWPRPPSSRLP